MSSNIFSICQRHGDDGSPVEKGAEYDEDVPDAMVIRVLRLFVVHKEIDACGVGDAFEHYQYDGPEVDAFAYGGDDVEYWPPQQQVEDEGGFGKALEKKDLEEDACQRYEPDDTEGYPTGNKVIVFDDCHADRGVARSDEQIDGAMVQYA